jgi:hypothetical protein
MPPETERTTGPKNKLQAAQALISEYAMAFDLLTKIAHSFTEQETIQRILEVFEILFSPGTCFYVSLNPAHQPEKVYSSGNLTEEGSSIKSRLHGFSANHQWTASGKGFQVMIRYGDTDLGILEIDDVKFPEQKNRYLNLTLSMAEVCGLAIENAKRYQIIKDAENKLRKEKERLEKALSEVKTLSGLIPICSHCKKIRDDKGYWNQVEAYIQQHSDVKFSHGICQECIQKYYSEM